MSVSAPVAYASKILSLGAIVGTSYWFGDTHEAEPLISLLGSLAAYILIDTYIHPEEPSSVLRPTPSEHDRLLIAQLLSDLPSDGKVMRFLSEQDLGSSFLYEPIASLDKIAERWCDAEHEFLDEELERMKNNFIELARTFVQETALKTQPLGNGWVTIGMSDWEERVDKIALRDHLNALGWEIYNAHQDLVKVARRKLPPLNTGTAQSEG